MRGRRLRCGPGIENVGFGHARIVAAGTGRRRLQEGQGPSGRHRIDHRPHRLLGDHGHVPAVLRRGADERDLLVYDTVTAQSESNFLGPFLNATKPQDEGAKNLNVAISRAKKSLVVLADLKVLDAQLSNYSFLRDVLFAMQGGRAA